MRLCGALLLTSTEFLIPDPRSARRFAEHLQLVVECWSAPANLTCILLKSMNCQDSTRHMSECSWLTSLWHSKQLSQDSQEGALHGAQRPGAPAQPLVRLQPLKVLLGRRQQRVPLRTCTPKNSHQQAASSAGWVCYA